MKVQCVIIPKRSPNIVAQTVEPEKCAQQSNVQYNVGDHKTHMTTEFGENSHQIGGLTQYQAHGDRCDNVSD